MRIGPVFHLLIDNSNLIYVARICPETGKIKSQNITDKISLNTSLVFEKMLLVKII
jgi:hypothetical protein